MTFSSKITGYVVLGLSALTTLGCADVAVPELDDSMCSADHEGLVNCVLLLEQVRGGRRQPEVTVVSHFEELSP